MREFSVFKWDFGLRTHGSCPEFLDDRVAAMSASAMWISTRLGLPIQILPTDSNDSMTEIQQDLVLHLLREGDWHEATIAYAEEAGISHQEASDAVQQLAAQQNIRRNSIGWLTFAAVASVASLLAGWVLAKPF